MTAPTSPTPTDTIPGSSAPAAATIANLTASLRADYTALQNDLEQAQEMAADFQRQLAGKSNELAHFKVLLERTQTDLARLEGHTNELRQERHRLANEVMIAAELKATAEDLRAERDQSRREVEALRSALTASEADHQEQIKKRELEIARLRAAVEAARTNAANATAAGGPVAAGVRDRISELSATVERLESMIRDQSGKRVQPAKGASNEFIDISFDS
jgi:DNA repair exonuclease SbcCD ATPase subunit